MPLLTDDQVWGVEQERPAAKLCPRSMYQCGFWKMDENGNGKCTFDDYCFFKYHHIATEGTKDNIKS
jgi:hypothetical protein